MSYTFKPLKIGDIKIDFPVVLAALAGYSDLPYRLICRSCGAEYCTTEAMLDGQMLLAGKLRRRLVKLDDADHPVAGQIMGNDPETMAKAAVVLREMGFDVIDLNFACPVRKVLSRRRGGFMMSKPAKVLDVIHAVRRAVPDRPVTIKVRRAFDEADMEYEEFWQIARGAFEAGVAAVAVHARSVEQKYKGQADWNFLAGVKREFHDKTILGSGDIHTADDALRMLQQTGVDGVLAARGAIGNPWLFRQVQDIAGDRLPYKPTVQEQCELIDRHFKMTCESYGPRRGPKIMRKFCIKYARMHPHPSKVRHAFINIKSQKEWQAAIDQYYSD